MGRVPSDSESRARPSSGVVVRWGACLLGALFASQEVGTARAQTGFHGSPYLIVGTAGSSAWENYRKHSDATGEDHAAVQGAWADDRLTYSGLIQDSRDHVYLAPGLFLLRHPGLATPRWTGPTLLTTGSKGFDVRVAFVEADDAQGHLTTLLANSGGDLAGTSDLYNSGIGNQLCVHFHASPSGPSRTYSLRSATCGAVGSAITEGSQANHLSRVAGAVAQSVAEGQPLSWRLEQAGKNADLVVMSGPQELWRWAVAGPGFSLLELCDNSDGINYSNGSLDLSRLVPVMFVGATDTPASAPVNLSLGFAGYGPRLEPIAQPVAPGADVPVQVSLRDGAGATLVDPTIGVVVTATGGGPDGGVAVAPGASPGGVAAVHLAFQQPGTQVVRVALAEAPLVHVELPVTVEALPGLDAGVADAAAAPPDAEVAGADAEAPGPDAAAPPGPDAGGPEADAGPRAGALAFEASCGCGAGASPGWPGWALLVAAARLRRRRG